MSVQNEVEIETSTKMLDVRKAILDAVKKEGKVESKKLHDLIVIKLRICSNGTYHTALKGLIEEEKVNYLDPLDPDGDKRVKGYSLPEYQDDSRSFSSNEMFIIDKARELIERLSVASDLDLPVGEKFRFSPKRIQNDRELKTMCKNFFVIVSNYEIIEGDVRFMRPWKFDDKTIRNAKQTVRQFTAAEEMSELLSVDDRPHFIVSPGVLNEISFSDWLLFAQNVVHKIES